MEDVQRLLKIYRSIGIRPSASLFLSQAFSPSAETLEFLFPEEGPILELGCGFGFLANLLAMRSGSRSVLGVDRIEYRIRNAARASRELGLRNVDFLVGDLRDLPFPRAHFEAISLIDVFYYLHDSDQEVLLQRCSSVLRKGGRLLIKDFTLRPRWKYWALLQEEAVKAAFRNTFGQGARNGNWDGRTHVLGEETMMQRLKQIGFEVQHYPMDRGIPLPHLLYQCQKDGRH